MGLQTGECGVQRVSHFHRECHMFAGKITSYLLLRFLRAI